MFINKGSVYKFFSLVMPPILFELIKKNKSYSSLKKLANKYLKKDHHISRWHKIESGILKNRNIFIDSNGVGKDMVSGEYDKSFFDHLKKMGLDLKGKVIFDIGAHIGYSSLCFAEIVGDAGKVYAFEPNIYNKKRFEFILTKNQDLCNIIKIYNIAISNKEGQEDFLFSDNIENGTSSGSFIASADTFFDKNYYIDGLNFEKISVKTAMLDLLGNIGIKDKPDLIKIDIEGAEYLALSGGQKMLKEVKPILLIEIHSIFNMFKCYEILLNSNYKLQLLNEESDGRCFILAEYKI